MISPSEKQVAVRITYLPADNHPAISAWVKVDRGTTLVDLARDFTKSRGIELDAILKAEVDLASC